MNTSHGTSERPASSTSTRLLGLALSRFASALPAEPPPTMTKSYCAVPIGRLLPPPGLAGRPASPRSQPRLDVQYQPRWPVPSGILRNVRLLESHRTPAPECSYPFS